MTLLLLGYFLLDICAAKMLDRYCCVLAPFNYGDPDEIDLPVSRVFVI
jgi:hypothetical protein